MQVGLSQIVRKELNIAAGSAGERAKLGDNLHRSLVGRSVTLTPGDEASSAITVAVQVLDGLGESLSGATDIEWWLSDTAAAAPTSTAPTSATVVSTGVVLKEYTDKVYGKVLSDNTGAAAIKVTQSAAVDYYFNAIIDGNIVSQLIEFSGE